MEDLSLVVWGGLMEVEVGVVMAFCSWVEVVALLALFDLLCVQVVEVVYLVGHFVYYYRPEYQPCKCLIQHIKDMICFT